MYVFSKGIDYKLADTDSRSSGHTEYKHDCCHESDICSINSCSPTSMPSYWEELLSEGKKFFPCPGQTYVGKKWASAF